MSDSPQIDVQDVVARLTAEVAEMTRRAVLAEALVAAYAARDGEAADGD